VKNEMISVARQERDSVARHAAKFGMTARDRQSIEAAPPKPRPKMTTSEFVEMLKAAQAKKKETR
jgi:hypothetical protein